MPSTLPSIPNPTFPEKRKAGRPAGSSNKKSKADDMENKAYGYIMEMFENYEKLKTDKTFAERIKADPYLASTFIKDLSQLAKRILDITVAKLRIEELKNQKASESGVGEGTKNVFIIQGLYDSSAPKTIEVTTDDGPVKFQTKGLEG